ncbi:MAG TPA: GNAT family protein [Anaerolineae bacterium]|nr:GNAT family protein [Anaerolineae bacterium]
MRPLLYGEHVRLATLTSSNDIAVMQHWTAHSAAWRLLDGAQTAAQSLRGLAREAREDLYFLVYLLNGEHPIGQASLFGIQRPAGAAWLGIGLGAREHWEAGHGSDAIRALLCYAFVELGLNRLWLGVFDYDARAIRSYEEAGFVIEGRMLQEATRTGRPKAGVYMGLRREAWQSAACEA